MQTEKTRIDLYIPSYSLKPDEWCMCVRSLEKEEKKERCEREGEREKEKESVRAGKKRENERERE